MSAFLKSLAIGTSTLLGGVSGFVGGAALGANTPIQDGSTTSIIGGITGTALGLGAGVMATNPLQTASVLTKAGLGIGNAAFSVGMGIGKGATMGAGVLGYGTAKYLGPLVANAGQREIAKLNAIGNLGSKLIERAPFEKSLVGAKATWAGKGLFAAASFAGGVHEAFDDFNRKHTGYNDGTLVRATPQMPSYANNAGATGDLVFALNRNRRG